MISQALFKMHSYRGDLAFDIFYINSWGECFRTEFILTVIVFDDVFVWRRLYRPFFFFLFMRHGMTLFNLRDVRIQELLMFASTLCCFDGLVSTHTPSIAFRHLPPNSARFSYVTEGALFISAQLSIDAVSALRKVRVLIRLWKQPSA